MIIQSRLNMNVVHNTTVQFEMYIATEIKQLTTPRLMYTRWKLIDFATHDYQLFLCKNNNRKK